MPITYQYGTPSMYAQAAQMIGEAERIKTEQSIALQQQEMKAREKLTERQNQLSIESEMRSREWELQKMTIASQNDFMQEEKKRQFLADRELAKEVKNKDELEAGIKVIRESTQLSGERGPDGTSEKEKAIYAFTMKKQFGLNVPRDTGKLNLSGIDLTDLTPETVEKEESNRRWYDPLNLIGGTAKFREHVSIPGMAGLGGRFGGGIDMGTNTPPIVQKVVKNLQLSETDEQKLNNLNAESKASFEAIFNGDNPELIQLALNRLRNL